MAKQQRNNPTSQKDEGTSVHSQPAPKSTLKGDNPLARARSSKRDVKAEELWHRKMSGGYHLFLLYYAGQASQLLPESDSSRDTTLPLPPIAHSLDSSSSPKLTNAGGNGESRASKRRKRKRQKTEPPTRNPPNSSISTAATVPTNEKHEIKTREPLVLHRLVEAFSAIRTKHAISIESSHALQPLVESLALPLPICFRLRQTLSKKDLTHFQAEIENEFGEQMELVSFHKTDSAFYVYRAKKRGPQTISKDALRKQAPEFKSWLLKNTNAVARQELGSILPVLLLSQGNQANPNGWMQPGSRVLDLCASPGSKTLQALELIGGTGKIKANDINKSRLDSLRDAVQRANLQNVQGRVKYTNHDASQFPIPKQSHKLFDAIICDVPCSGDGTIRKDPHILPNWTPNTSNALHSLQVKILVRALQCVKVGGVVSYSTCSLNPVENEAVVAAALNQITKLKRPQVCAQLVDCPTFSNFSLRSGVTKWSVADFVHSPTSQQQDAEDSGEGKEEEEEEETPKLRWHETYEDALAAQMEHATLSLWPTTNQSTDLNLEKCARLWPQDHDCGGFFVALIQRTA